MFDHKFPFQCSECFRPYFLFEACWHLISLPKALHSQLICCWVCCPLQLLSNSYTSLSHSTEWVIFVWGSWALFGINRCQRKLMSSIKDAFVSTLSNVLGSHFVSILFSHLFCAVVRSCSKVTITTLSGDMKRWFLACGSVSWSICVSTLINQRKGVENCVPC